MILENNLIFCLTLSLIITVVYYFTSNETSKEYRETEIKNNMILLFGVSFIVSFLLKFCISNHSTIKSGEASLTHSSRPPF